MKLRIEMTTNARASYWEALLGAGALYVIYHLFNLAQ
jgi:hypothetical protein